MSMIILTEKGTRYTIYAITSGGVRMRDHSAAAMEVALAALGKHLQSETRLVLIGSSVGMLYGQPGRMTEDIDVWAPTSEYDTNDLIQACQKAGIEYNPTDMLEPEGMYLQLIRPGVVKVGKWRQEEKLARYGNLTVVHPPVEHIIASKLACGDSRHIEDAVFLIARFQVSREAIDLAIDTMHPLHAETARENSVFLDLFDLSSAPKSKPSRDIRI